MMEFKMDAPVKTSYELAGETVGLVNSGNLIQAVKLVRDWTGMSLRDSKQVVDILRDEMRNGYDWEYGRPLELEDLDVLNDFAEGALIGVITATRPRYGFLSHDV